jgi:hypothetical protein
LRLVAKYTILRFGLGFEFREKFSGPTPLTQVRIFLVMAMLAMHISSVDHELALDCGRAWNTPTFVMILLEDGVRAEAPAPIRSPVLRALSADRVALPIALCAQGFTFDFGKIVIAFLPLPLPPMDKAA